MLLDRQAMEDLITLWNECEPRANNLVGIPARALATVTTDFDAIQLDRAALLARKPGDGIEERRLAVTIEADETDASPELTIRSRSCMTRMGPYPAESFEICRISDVTRFWSIDAVPCTMCCLLGP